MFAFERPADHQGKFGHHVIDADGHGGDLPDWQARIPAEYQGHWEERKAKIAKQFAISGPRADSSVVPGHRP